jgi:hypothetical protein
VSPAGAGILVVALIASQLLLPDLAAKKLRSDPARSPHAQ